MASSRLLIYITDFQGHLVTQRLIPAKNLPDLLLNVKDDVLENIKRSEKVGSRDYSLPKFNKGMKPILKENSRSVKNHKTNYSNYYLVKIVR